MNTTQWLKSLKKKFSRIDVRHVKRRNTRRKQSVRSNPSEVLESRVLLAGINCLAQIEGVTFQDLSGDGVLDASAPRLSNAADGVVVHLFSLGMDGILNSAGNGGVAVGDDTAIGTELPDVNGRYVFSDLAAGTYAVEQPTPATYILKTGAGIFGPIVISAAAAEGTPGVTIDDFSLPAPPSNPPHQVQADPFGSNPDFEAAAAANVLGGERDLFVELSAGAGAGAMTLSANNFASEILELSGTASSLGFGVVTREGPDGVAAPDNMGLGGFDLTNPNATTGFRFDFGADKMNQIMTLTVHSTDGSKQSLICFRT